MFYNLIISPIEMIVNWVFNFFIFKFTHFGVIGAICGVSLVINFLALPLYNIADSLQEKERKISKALEYRVSRIKKAFKGDERFMMLQTYYRQNNYSPLYVLRSSLSILIEIPFFIAAYHFLSNCEALNASSFWIFKDLGSPDRLFSFGNFSINILPVLMTIINFISGAIYTKDAPFKEKIQLYIMALIFLVLLYNSPSGLVIYWILNNLFSLVKNIVMKTKNPGKILHIAISSMLFLMAIYFFLKEGALDKKIIVLIFSVFVAVFPFLKSKIKFIKKFNEYAESEDKSGLGILIFSGLAMALLCGLYLPSSVIATSPIEFSFLGNTPSPVSYIYSSFSTFLGFFLFWPLCIYFMFGNKVKKIEPVLFFVLFLTAVINVFVFSPDYGNFDVNFALEDPEVLEASFLFKINPLLVSVFFVIVFFLLKKIRKQFILSVLIIAICCSEVVLSASKIQKINKSHSEYKDSQFVQSKKSNEIKPCYHLSKDKNNVVVLFLDRAINSFLPYALKQLPELNEQLKGFVYYPNTLSFSTQTTLASPSLMGGYEYSPENINKRGDELLQKKHNEASLVMPLLFSDAGYKVTVSDPPFPNYKWKGDLSAFKNYGINAFEIVGKYSNNFTVKDENLDYIIKKEVKNFSVLQILYPFLRSTFYKICQKKTLSQSYIDQVSSLFFLPEQTDFTSEENNFIFMTNETTHQPTNLDENFIFPAALENKNLLYKTDSLLTNLHYQSFVSAFKQIGKWLDYLKENKVYDNTRIIIVSDHGRNIELSAFSDFKDSTIPSAFTPLLLVKDFNASSPISTCNDFMTNADTLFFAKKDLNISNINPFTKKEFLQSKKDGVSVYFATEEGKEWNADYMIDKTQFTLDKKMGWHVSENIFDEKNWIPIFEYESEISRGEK